MDYSEAENEIMRRLDEISAKVTKTERYSWVTFLLGTILVVCVAWGAMLFADLERDMERLNEKVGELKKALVDQRECVIKGGAFMYFD